jgi:hypothetical protein
LIGAVAGVIVPASFILSASKPWFPVFYLGPFFFHIQTVSRALWPADILLAPLMHYGVPATVGIVLLLSAFLLNIATYAAIGALLWIGILRNRKVLYATGILIFGWFLIAFGPWESHFDIWLIRHLPVR